MVKEQEDRWTEHFKEILNRDPPLHPLEIQEASEVLVISTNPPTKVEIIQAIQSLKNGKSSGADNLNVELFKADTEVAANILLPLYTNIWMEGKIPSDWTKGVIVKVPKKGAISDCNNWRGITLLSVPSKIFCFAEGKGKKGRSKMTWCRTIEKELQQHHLSWGIIEKMAKDRQKWRDFVAALYASRRNGDKTVKPS